MAYYRVIEITNLEPLKIGSQGFQSSYAEPTKDYIPGSTLRGALIGQLIRMGAFNESSKANYLLGMECYNAYPYYENDFYLPKPLHLRVNKHTWRKNRAVGEGKVALNDLLHKSEEKSKNHLEYSFLTTGSKIFRGRKVAKEYRLHHSTHKRQEEREKENLFRYQAISSGQCFRGIVKYQEEQEAEIGTLLKQELTLYLGGSKGSGYGESKITSVFGPVKDYREIKKILGMDTYVPGIRGVNRSRGTAYSQYS